MIQRIRQYWIDFVSPSTLFGGLSSKPAKRKPIAQKLLAFKRNRLFSKLFSWMSYYKQLEGNRRSVASVCNVLYYYKSQVRFNPVDELYDVEFDEINLMVWLELEAATEEYKNCMLTTSSVMSSLFWLEGSSYV